MCPVCLRFLDPPVKRKPDLWDNMLTGTEWLWHRIARCICVPLLLVLQLDQQLHYRGFPVVTPAQGLLGVVTITDVRQALATGLHDTPVERIATTDNLVYVHPDHTLNWVMQQLGEHEVSLLPVVTRETPAQLVGVLTRADVVRAFARHKAE